jgi:hypothetical protein
MSSTSRITSIAVWIQFSTDRNAPTREGIDAIYENAIVRSNTGIKINATIAAANAEITCLCRGYFTRVDTKRMYSKLSGDNLPIDRWRDVPDIVSP